MHLTARCLLPLLLSAATLSACSTDSIVPDRRIDYHNSRPGNSLEIPPDLASLSPDQTMTIPAPGQGASLSEYGNGPSVGLNAPVLPQVQDVEIRREGGQRYLVVQNVPPDALWYKVKEFLISNGLSLTKEDPATGIMETQWAENRADIPDDGIRAILKKAVDFAYSAPTRDKFKLRFERAGKSGSALYITHYGMQEVSKGRDNETTRWEGRPNDPELEAELLNRLMISLGASKQAAAAELAKGGAGTPGARVSRTQGADGSERLVVRQDYDNAWRLVGLTLDNGQFIVEDQDRQRGLYRVEYRDPDEREAAPSGGLLSSLGFWKDNAPTPGSRHHVRLAGQDGQTVIVVQTPDGQPDRSESAKLLLSVLERALR